MAATIEDTALGTIYSLYGVVPQAQAERFVHRNLSDQRALIRFLQRRRESFVGLHEAIHGTGDALTIDDGTVAARDAAVLARQFGHEVTVFVNPWHVETGEPYWFSLLNAALDSSRAPLVMYAGQRHKVVSAEDKHALRQSVKGTMTSFAHESDRRDHLQEVVALLGSGPVELPNYLRVLRLPELQELVALGVHIENHGWSHIELSRTPRETVLREIVDGSDWLLRNCGVRAMAFAAPFGLALPPAGINRDAGYDWLLLDARLPCGRIEDGVYNRSSVVRWL